MTLHPTSAEYLLPLMACSVPQVDGTKVEVPLSQLVSHFGEERYAIDELPLVALLDNKGGCVS